MKGNLGILRKTALAEQIIASAVVSYQIMLRKSTDRRNNKFMKKFSRKEKKRFGDFFFPSKGGVGFKK